MGLRRLMHVLTATILSPRHLVEAAVVLTSVILHALSEITWLVTVSEGPKGFSVIFRHLSSVVKSAALKKSGYPQVPCSFPAQNTSTQLHIHLSILTLK